MSAGGASRRFICSSKYAQIYRLKIDASQIIAGSNAVIVRDRTAKSQRAPGSTAKSRKNEGPLI